MADLSSVKPDSLSVTIKRHCSLPVILTVPESERHKIPYAHLEGEHYAHDGKTGELIAGAPNGGAWVIFDGKTVGCPASWLKVIKPKT